jgi:hypothetical protein
MGQELSTVGPVAAAVFPGTEHQSPGRPSNFSCQQEKGLASCGVGFSSLFGYQANGSATADRQQGIERALFHLRMRPERRLASAV